MKTPPDIHAFENRLFDEWQRRSLRCGDGGEIAYDGLLYRGAFAYDSGYWSRLPGNEAAGWQHAPQRILILTKDLNDTEAWDIRVETGRQNHSGADHILITAPFYKNLMRWVYGILHTSPGIPFPAFDAINRQDLYQPFYDHAPIARVNCKKQPGGASLPNPTLRAFLTRYRDLLARQINAYDAHIILCCGGSDLIKDFVRETLLPDLRRINDWIYRSPSTRQTLINSYHPSYRGMTHRDLYTSLLTAYHSAL